MYYADQIRLKTFELKCFMMNTNDVLSLLWYLVERKYTQNQLENVLIKCFSCSIQMMFNTLTLWWVLVSFVLFLRS